METGRKQKWWDSSLWGRRSIRGSHGVSSSYPPPITMYPLSLLASKTPEFQGASGTQLEFMFHNRNYFPKALEARSGKPRCGQGSAPLEACREGVLPTLPAPGGSRILADTSLTALPPSSHSRLPMACLCAVSSYEDIRHEFRACPRAV